VKQREELDFADDISLFSHRQQDTQKKKLSQKKQTRLACKSTEKMEIMRVNKKDSV
jgi:hypothetical protein